MRQRKANITKALTTDTDADQDGYIVESHSLWK